MTHPLGVLWSLSSDVQVAVTHLDKLALGFRQLNVPVQSV